MNFVKDFLDETAEIVLKLNENDIESVVKVIAAVRDRGGRLFLAGSGGGAGHASHATCDFRKLCGIEAYCATDNVSELTARANDEGWETSISEWLVASRLTSKDALMLFSVGGGSTEKGVSVNLVRAADLALQAGAPVLGILGRDGGHVRRIGTASIVVPTVNQDHITPHVEGMQAVLWHLIVSHPALAKNPTKWESVSRKDV